MTPLDKIEAVLLKAQSECFEDSEYYAEFKEALAAVQEIRDRAAVSLITPEMENEAISSSYWGVGIEAESAKKGC